MIFSHSFIRPFSSCSSLSCSSLSRSSLSRSSLSPSFPLFLRHFHQQSFFSPTFSSSPLLSRNARSLSNRKSVLSPLEIETKIEEMKKKKEYPFDSMTRFFFMPLYGIEKYPPTEIRDIITTITSNVSLCSAIMGGVSVAALLGFNAERHTIEHKEPDPFLQWLIDLLPDIPSLAAPFLLLSTFACLQNLGATTMIQCYSWAVPLPVLVKFTRKHHLAIASCGYLMVPSLSFLSLGLVCISYATGLCPFWLSFGAVFGLGVTSFAQTFIFLFSAFKIRKRYFVERTFSSVPECSSFGNWAGFSAHSTSGGHQQMVMRAKTKRQWTIPNRVIHDPFLSSQRPIGRQGRELIDQNEEFRKEKRKSVFGKRFSKRGRQQ